MGRGIDKIMRLFMQRDKAQEQSLPGAAGTPASDVSNFTAHNIRLDNGTQTFPSAGGTIDQHPVFLSVRRLLQTVYHGCLEGKTIIDVGCLEGGYATEFARLGMTSTGLEVRESNYNNCLFV
jgi:hypothetical protein